MGGRSLLQALLVAVILGTAIAQSFNDGSSVVFPVDQPNREVVNRFLEPVPQVSVRAREAPMCVRQAGDPSAPCVVDQDYNVNVINLVSMLLGRSNSINDIIRDPMLSLILNDTLTPVPGQNGPSTRFGGPTETTVCAAREELIFPQRAKTPKNDWVFVVNQDNVKQALRVERCFQEGRPCDFGTARTGDVTTICRQKYVYRRMLTVGTNAIEPEEVLMPSCCVCYRQSTNFDIASRVGVNNTNDEARTALPGETSNPAGQPAAAQPPSAPQSGEPLNFVNRGDNRNIMLRSALPLNRPQQFHGHQNNNGFNPYYHPMGGR